MRFMWESNSPWSGTGYGQQTKHLLKAFLQMGHEPHCFCFYGLHGNRIAYDGYECWPNSDFDAWGNDVLGAHLENSHAEALITLMDLFVMDKEVVSNLKVPWLAWAPIDSEGIGHPTMEILNLVPFPVAMSYSGADQMKAEGVVPADVIWHCVDTESFYPRDKYESRKEIGVDDDAYVIGMVMANKGDRKQYPAQFQAIRRWMDEHPDRKVQVFMHTDPTHKMGGWDMKALVKQMGLEGKVYATSQYYATITPVDNDQLARFYSAFDVLMNVSAGEGFGIPIVEAQACGVPVITGSWTSMPELTHYGYTVEPKSRSLGHHYGWYYGADIDDMVYRLESVYRMASADQSADAVAWVHQNFNVASIAAQWDELLKGVER